MKTLIDKMKVEIALASDLRFFPGLFMTVCSIAHNASREVQLLFHIMNDGLDDTCRSNLEIALDREHPNSAIDWLYVDPSQFNHLREWRQGGRMTWARLLLPQLLNSSEWVIYVDVDFLCLADIAELWKLRTEGISLMSVPDNWPIAIPPERACFERHGLKFDSSRYFCAGLCFFNLARFRKFEIDKRCFQLSRFVDFPANDQSVLNAVFSDRDDLKMISRKWQTFTRDMTYEDIIHCPMIHFAGDAPWVSFRINHIFNDSALLWFRIYAKLKGVGVWECLREFYSPVEILGYRMLYLMFSRVRILRKFLYLYFRIKGHIDSISIYEALLHKIKMPKLLDVWPCRP